MKQQTRRLPFGGSGLLVILWSACTLISSVGLAGTNEVPDLKGTIGYCPMSRSQKAIEVIVSDVRSCYEARARWAHGQEPDRKYMPYFAIGVRTSNETVRVVVNLKDVNTIKLTHEPRNESTDDYFSTLTITMHDRARHRWTLVPKQPRDWGPYRYELIDGNGTLQKEATGLLDFSLPDATAVDAHIIGIPGNLKVPWTFRGFAGKPVNPTNIPFFDSRAIWVVSSLYSLDSIKLGEPKE